jgi:glycine cleavage system regulatory protein
VGTLAAGSVAGCNLLATSSARAVNTTTGKFLFQVELQWDSISKLLHGQFTDQISNLLDGWAATTAATTLAQDADLNFLLSATLSAGNAANVVTLFEFAQMAM